MVSGGVLDCEGEGHTKNVDIYAFSTAALVLVLEGQVKVIADQPLLR